MHGCGTYILQPVLLPKKEPSTSYFFEEQVTSESSILVLNEFEKPSWSFLNYSEPSVVPGRELLFGSRLQSISSMKI